MSDDKASSSSSELDPGSEQEEALALTGEVKKVSKKIRAKVSAIPTQILIEKRPAYGKGDSNRFKLAFVLVMFHAIAILLFGLLYVAYATDERGKAAQVVFEFLSTKSGLLVIGAISIYYFKNRD